MTQKVLQMVLQFRGSNVIIVASMFMWAVDNKISRHLTSRASPAKIVMVKSLATGPVLHAISLALGNGSVITNIEFSLL
jgi:hypothetical protein